MHSLGSIFCLPDDQQMNCVLEKGWSPQSSGCYRLRMQAGREGTRVGDAQRQDGIPVRLSPEYPTGTHGALFDRFCTGRMLLKLLPILGTPTNSYHMKLGLLSGRAHRAVNLHIPSILLSCFSSFCVRI